jgi:DNA-binding transcriptional LysR family regulator
MELAELRVFVAVASERSFSRAAEKLGRTQPAISQAIRRLEEELGEQLIARTTRSNTLTPAGEVLLRGCGRLLKLAEETEAAVRRRSDQERAVVRIGADELAADTLLSLLPGFMGRHPAMGVDVRRMREDEIVGALDCSAIDFGIAPSERVPSRLQHIPFGQSRFSLLLHRGHPLSRARDVLLSACRGLRIVIPSEPLEVRAQIATMLSDAGVTPQALIALPGMHAVRRAVEMKLGIAIVPQTLAMTKDAERAVVVAELADGPDSTGLSLMFRHDAPLLNGSAEFLALARMYTGANAAAPLRVAEHPSERRAGRCR